VTIEKRFAETRPKFHAKKCPFDTYLSWLLFKAALLDANRRLKKEFN